MNFGLYIATQDNQNILSKTAHLTQQMSNNNVTGFKRTFLEEVSTAYSQRPQSNGVSNDFLTNNLLPDFMQDASNNLQPNSLNSMGFALSLIESNNKVDLSNGPIVSTNRPLDFALSEKDFLQVLDDQNLPALTKNGALRIGNDGALVTETGRRVLDLNLNPIVLNAEGKYELSADGSVLSLNAETNEFEVVADLAIISTNDPKSVTLRDDGFFSVPLVNQAIRSGNITPMSLEKANINVNEVLVGLIEMQRKLDINQTIIRKMVENDQKSSQLLSPN